MPGIKIINVLKDDTLAEILDIFRQAPVGEVIFVLPKNGKLFRKEDHFSAFASEAANGGKTISILSSNPATAALARKYKFNVMSAGKGKEEPDEVDKPATAVLASSPPPADDEVRDDEDSAPDADSRVVGTSDETMGTVAGEEEDAEKMEGFHVEDSEGPVDVDADGDGNADEPKAKDVEYGDADLTAIPVPVAPIRATLAATVDGVRVTRAKKSVPQPKKAVRADNIDIPVTREREETVEEIEEILEQPSPVAAPRSAVSADLDYIDAVWRQKAAANVPATPTTDSVAAPVRPGRSWRSYLRVPSWPSFPKGGSLHASKRMVTGALALSVLLLGAAIYLTAGAATVSINPTGRPIDLQLTVQASDVFSTVDANFNKIPGQLFEVSKTASAKQDATGSRDVASKARVRLTVSNEYSSTPQTLVATTRFATPDGLVFRTLQSVTVPGSTVSEGKPVAGTVQVDVIADKPGPQYNVPAGKWTIVAFQEKGDTERAAKIYGASTEAASGGASGPSKVVTQADYDKARAEAVASVKEQIATAFGQQQSGLRILDEAEPALADVTSTARPDDAAESVTVTASGTLRTVAFRQDDLDQLIVDSVLARERLVVVPAQLDLTFSDIAFKADTGVLSFSVTIKGTGYAPLDAQAIKNDIKGKNGQQIRDYFADKEGVESATVSLRPFWVRKVPQKDSRIEVTVNYGTPTAVTESD